MSANNVVMLISFRVQPDADAAFNNWYNTIHLPELLAIPGIKSARRLTHHTEPHNYLTIYEVEDALVFESETFQRWRSSAASNPPSKEWVLAFERTLYIDIETYAGHTT